MIYIKTAREICGLERHALVFANRMEKNSQYPVKNGGKDVTVYAIYKDNIGELWLVTQDAGVFKYNGFFFEKFTPLLK